VGETIDKRLRIKKNIDALSKKLENMSDKNLDKKKKEPQRIPRCSRKKFQVKFIKLPFVEPFGYPLFSGS